MNGNFRHYDSLRLFVEVARHPSFSEAAEALNMTKGAVSYQIKVLEGALGLELFARQVRGVALTDAGRELLRLARGPFRELEGGLSALRAGAELRLTVGLSSYFASRWLSPRLMRFMQAHPEIQLRLQPMTQLFNLEGQGVDLAIRWGHGRWGDAEITPLMRLPAWPTGNAAAAEAVERLGLERAFAGFTLLRDHDDSDAWSDWYDAARLPQRQRRDTLIIPDPNVRVQAVIDGQGVALNDALVGEELQSGRLRRLSEVALDRYGYFLAVPRAGRPNRAIALFRDWVLDAA